MNLLPPLPSTWPGAAYSKFDKIFVAPVPPDTPEDIRVRLVFFAGQNPEVHSMARGIVDRIGLPRFCPRPPCRRAGRCGSRYIVCFIEQRKAIREVVEEERARHG